MGLVEFVAGPECRSVLGRIRVFDDDVLAVLVFGCVLDYRVVGCGILRGCVIGTGVSRLCCRRGGAAAGWAAG
jgi:hypothetical protein